LKRQNYYKVRFIPSWLGYGLIRLFILLPYPVIYRLSKLLGVLFYYLAGYRRTIAQTNIDLCFAELSEQNRQQICKEHFQSIAIALFDTAINWWGNKKKLLPYMQLEGVEHLQQAATEKKRVIILSGHFTSLETAGHFVQQYVRFATSYQALKNPFFNELMIEARSRNFCHIVDRNNVRDMIRTIRQGIPLWIAPDQDQGRKKSVFVPFFNQQTATQIGPMKLTEMTDATVIPAFTRHFGTTIRTDILPALENFPSSNIENDARRINELLEYYIRETPEQYLWLHRRFKTRPSDNDVSLYPTKKRN